MHRIRRQKDGVGVLFMTNGGHVSVGDGDTVTLGGGRKWQASHTAEGLQLTIGHPESNSRQQVSGRKADIQNELEHRKRDVEALQVQNAELQTKMVQVVAPDITRTCMCSAGCCGASVFRPTR